MTEAVSTLNLAGMKRRCRTSAAVLGLAIGLAATNVAAQPVPLASRGGVDIDGNNRSVLLVRSTTNSGAATLVGGRLVSGQFQFTQMSDPGANFRLVGAPDFDGNGKSDLAFQNTTQGEFGDVRSWTDFLPPTDKLIRQVKQVWDVQAVGDLDGDGRGDLVWRYVVANSPDTGVSYIWFTNASGAPTVRKRGGAPLTWKLLGAVDLNGDRAADMVYASPDGQIRVLMATENRTCANFGAGTVPAGFVALAFADFTGRGRGDVLMRNPTTGQVQLASLNASGLTLPRFTGDPDNRDANCTSTTAPLPSSTVTLPNSDPSWQLYAIGDFNGDGIFDVVWLKPDGNLALWQTNAPASAQATTATVTTSANVGAAPVGSTNYAVFQGVTPPSTSVAAKNTQAAVRFLAQASFGATAAEIDRVNNLGIAGWIEDQFNKPQTLHLPATAAWLSTVTVQPPGSAGFTWSLWRNFTQADDQLRQRVAFALSQIFVISLNDGNVGTNVPRGMANYMDMLGARAFGNFRDLLNDVTYSPMMGIYLTYRGNQKENPTTGAVPDENYAREVMQLFTIGLYQLNIDGTPKLGSNGQPIETYTNADITNLAKAFTGLSWAGPDTSNTRFFGGTPDPDREIKPMQAYNQYHSTSAKTFLGFTLPATTTSTVNTNAEVKAALDLLFNHPNVAPFISDQLIQRLVTSNPSAGYVTRVAQVFNDNGLGVRGDLKAVIRAILLDPEARDLAMTNAETGKIREPVLRFVHWMRAFNARSNDGRFLLGDTSDPSTALAQSPMRSPTVFNFFRPGYVPPNSSIGNAGLVSPEMQITNETSVAGYINFMRTAISAGAGATVNGVRDIQPDYTAELGLANDPDALLDRVSMLLTGGVLTQATRTAIRTAIASVPIGTANPNNDRRNRVNMAIYLLMASPEYIVQN